MKWKQINKGVGGGYKIKKIPRKITIVEDTSKEWKVKYFMVHAKKSDKAQD